MQEIKEETTYGTCDVTHATKNVGLLIGGIGLGALLMYLFDVDRGRGRRSRLSDQLTSKANRLGRVSGSKARDLKNRAQGLVHEARSVLKKTGEKGRSIAHEDLGIANQGV